MLATCFCAVAGTSNAATEIKPIVSDETVVLDIHEDFNSNKDQLAKLGITDYKDWRYSNEDQCYVLTLNNVHFVTTANVAIAFCCDVHETETKEQSIIVKLVGENTIISGSDMVFKMPENEKYCASILAGTISGDTSVNLIFKGDGELVVSNNITSKDVIATAAIVSDGTVAVLDEAVVLANGGDFTSYFRVNDYKAGMRYSSYGVTAPNVLVTSTLIAVGGNVDVLFPPDSVEMPDSVSIYIVSDGMYADTYTFLDGSATGVGGEVYFGTTGFSFRANDVIKSHSSGIAINEDATGTPYDTYITGSKVVGKSSWVKGITAADSAGIELGAKANGKIVIKESILIGNADTAECMDTLATGRIASSVGIFFIGQTEITDSLVSAASGELAMGGKSSDQSVTIKQNLLIGIYASDAMTVKNSIINASGRGLDSMTENMSFGIIASDMKSSNKDINVIDSEVYAAGKTTAVYANKINASLSPRAVYKLDSGSAVTITVADITSSGLTGPKSVELLYAYDLIVDSTLFGITAFHRYTTDTCIAHSYHGFVPDGLKFAGYYMLVNGDVVNVKVGQVLNLNSVTPTYVFATFEVAEQDNGNPAVAWIVVIVALIIVALLVVGICVWKSRH